MGDTSPEESLETGDGAGRGVEMEEAVDFGEAATGGSVTSCFTITEDEDAELVVSLLLDRSGDMFEIGIEERGCFAEDKSGAAALGAEVAVEPAPETEAESADPEVTTSSSSGS